MSEKTYIELCKNEKKTVQIRVWTDEGNTVNPSAAYYQVKGRKKDNTIVPRSAATVNGNTIYTRITQTVTGSAAPYDLYWELRKAGGDVEHHCTKILVIDTC